VITGLPSRDDPAWDRMAAAAAGEDLDTYLAWKRLNASLDEEGGAYRDRPVAEWPNLHFNWDLSPEGQRFALDAVNAVAFRKQHPDGFRLGRIPLPTFDRFLCHFSRRDGPSELWELGAPWKLAKVIAYVRRGLAITPPLVATSENELRIAGGHHRYAAAKAVNLEILPFYAAPSDVPLIDAIVQVDWA